MFGRPSKGGVGSVSGKNNNVVKAEKPVVEAEKPVVEAEKPVVKAKNPDKVKFLDFLRMDNIMYYLRCEEQYNYYKANKEGFPITTLNVCPKVKYYYIAEKLELYFLYRLPFDDHFQADFFLKLKVYLCLNPSYIPDIIFDYKSIDNLSNNLLKNIILINQYTKPTTENKNAIYVLNCHFKYVPDHFKNVTLHIQPSNLPLSYRPPDWLLSVVFYGFEEEMININYHFCARNNMKNISYKGMSSLRKVANLWMKGCSNLETVDFTGLTSLQTVGYDWMTECPKLKTVDFTGLTSLQTVGDKWMKGCSNLETVDFTGLKSLQTVGNDWMKGCPKLKTIKQSGLIPVILERLDNIGKSSSSTIHRKVTEWVYI